MNSMGGNFDRGNRDPGNNDRGINDQGNDNHRLDALFGTYRAACGSPEPSANFMPGLWARIESRQSLTFSFRRMANAFATAAMALSLALGVYMAIPSSTPSSYNESYVEVLADASTPDPREVINPLTLEVERAGR